MMESIKNFKGYDKLSNPSPSQHHQPSISSSISKRRRILLAASFTILLTIFLAAMIGALIHESSTDSQESEEDQHPSPSASSSSRDSSLKTVCAVTLHPDSCFNSISSLNNPPKACPVHFFNLSLQFTLLDLKNLSSLPKTLLPTSNDRRTESALKDCLSLFDDSVSRVNESAQLMKVAPGEKMFTEIKISDMQTWISAAMTDLDTCLNGMEEMGSTFLDEVRVRVQKSEEYMSNTLAILNNLRMLVGKFGLTLP